MAIAAALALAGCGGDDDDSTTGGAANTTGAAETPRIDTSDLTPRQREKLEELRRKAQRLRREAREGAGSQGGSAAEVPFREPTGRAPTASGSLPNEGTRRVAPGVPTARGGDNSIQEYGVEAPSDDRVQASRIFQAYLNARLDGNWALACSYLSESMKAQLAQFGGQAQREGGRAPDCTQVMRAFTQGVPKEALRNAAQINVLSMRVENDQAFLLYRDGDDLPSSVPMNEEGDAWKVSAIAGSALFLGV